MQRNLVVVGLTGGIASGKSAVAKVLREAGLPVLDADELGHLVLEPGAEAFSPVVDAFGVDILDEAGTIDRRKLGAKVFGDQARRAQLEAITHPAIARLAHRGLTLVEEAGQPLAIYEAALLVETGAYKGLEALIVVSCDVATQLRRLMARDGLSAGDAAARIAAQFPLAEKLAVADYVIDNDGGEDTLRQRALDMAETLRQRFGGGA